MRLRTILIASLFLGISFSTFSQVISIPTVVHVVYNSTYPDISDAEIENYISEINDGFRKQLTPPFTPRAIFDSLWADTEIELCLAATDPSNNPTSGITHTLTSVGHYIPSCEPPVIAPYWPDGQYLNIWILPVYPEPGYPNFIVGGWASSPTTGNSWLGCIIALNSQPVIISKIMTHEIGHYFGLKHLTISDGIDDTPTGVYPIDPNIGYPTSCNPNDTLINSTSDDGAYWAGIDPPDMIENIMNFDFPCAYMFTKGQKEAMQNFITTYYSSMINTNCLMTGTENIETQNHISVYPNPSNGHFSFTGIDIQKIEIIDITGKTIFQTLITNKAKHSVDISAQPRGIYFARIITTHGIAIEKLIIQ